jgi:hypothetical protein
MSILDETRFVERQKFFNGQRLFAPDLQGLEEFNREMRWLHNRSLHQPGIGNGFAISAGKGDREVSIGPGYAIDALGREIVLTRAQLEPIPPVAGDGKGGSAFYDLTIAYPDDSELEEAETREGICQTRGVVRLREEPIFCWVRMRFQDGRFTAENLKLSKQIEEGMRLVLARVEIFECKLAQKPSIAQRRSARPSAQPYIACGTTALDVWQPVESNPANNSIKAEVDTSEAGFITTPCYSARIDRGEQADISGPLALPILVISDARPDRFTVTVTLFEAATGGGANLFSATALIASSLISSKRGVNLAAIPEAESILTRAAASVGDPLKYAKENQWRVVWMGVED